MVVFGVIVVDCDDFPCHQAHDHAGPVLAADQNSNVRILVVVDFHYQASLERFESIGEAEVPFAGSVFEVHFVAVDLANVGAKEAVKESLFIFAELAVMLSHGDYIIPHRSANVKTFFVLVLWFEIGELYR